MARSAWITGIQLVFMTSYYCNALEGWLVAGKFQANFTPPCEALCLSIAGDQGSGNLKPGNQVLLYGCFDIFNSINLQRWRYENNTLSVPATSTQDRLCLSASIDNDSVLLEQCNRSTSSQYWEIDDANQTIRNGELLYLKTSGDFLSLIQVSRTADSIFSLLPYEGSKASTATSMRNGDFSRVSPWMPARFGAQVQGPFRYSVCNWTLGSNNRDLERQSSAIPGCPSTRLNLNGSGSASQRISLVKGKQYILSFKHGGLGNSCTVASGEVGASGAAQFSMGFTSSSDGMCKDERIRFTTTTDEDVVITFSGAGGDQGCGPAVGDVAVDIAEGGNSGLPLRIILVIDTLVSLATGAVAAMAVYWIWRNYCFKLFRVQQLDESEDGPSLRRYTFQEIETMTDKFSHLLGKGGFGSVFLATTTRGTQYAVKAFQGEGADFKLELDMLGRVHHRCIVGCHGYCLDRGRVYLVLEYMTNGSLSDHLYGEDHVTLDWKKRVRIAKDVALGLLYLHHHADPPILHRDVKPGNVLLNQDFSAKLADFGISKAARIATDGHQVATTNTIICGTLVYMNPQDLLVSGKTDVYSYGVMLLELITGVKPSFTKNIVEWVKGVEFFQEVVDPRLGNGYDLRELKSLYDTALLCVDEYERRPIIWKVWDLIKDLGLDED